MLILLPMELQIFTVDAFVVFYTASAILSVYPDCG